MIIAGNTVGSNKPRANFDEKNPASASYIKNKPPKIVIGNTVPEGPALWLNTAPGTEASAANLILEDDEEGHPVQVAIEDETYGVTNATVNNASPGVQYNFTVL